MIKFKYNNYPYGVNITKNKIERLENITIYEDYRCYEYIVVTNNLYKTQKNILAKLHEFIKIDQVTE